jgi:hypothetical protein
MLAFRPSGASRVGDGATARYHRTANGKDVWGRDPCG